MSVRDRLKTDMRATRTDSVAAAWQSLHRGHTACDSQRERLIVRVEAVDTSKPREDGAMCRVHVECTRREGCAEQSNMRVQVNCSCLKLLVSEQNFHGETKGG